jgi:FecR protein
MSAVPCPRQFEVEAARDGRLIGAELASFERHMVGCPACLREAKAFEGVADALRASPRDARGEDMLHVRRERTRLLAAFDRALVGAEHSSGARRRLLWSAAVTALVTCAFVLWRVRPAAQPVHASAVVHADSTAVWSARRDGNREQIVLDRGALWIHVDHSSGDDRLLVVLPDGELEDTGTTFTVSAEEGRTMRVAVQEGSVVIRIRGQPPVSVGAGDIWVPEARPVALASASASACASSAPPAQPTPREQLSLSTPPPPLSARPGPSAPPATAVQPEPSVDFRAAMAALDVGDNAEAAAAFATFLVKHPHDPRAEDAAYLRVIALQRSGDTSRMKWAAQEYLRRHPRGFRRAEMETLSR